MMVRERFDAVIFDLDGTLVDTAPDLHAHLNELLAEHGRPGLELETVRPMIGDGMRTLIERGMVASGGLPSDTDLDTMFATYLERYSAAPLRLGAPYEGVETTLETLARAGITCGVCTNKPQVPTERLLAGLGLDRHFPVVIGGDFLAVKKPHADHIGTVLERLGVTAARAVMVGDSRTDVLAAQASGVPCVLVSFGYTAVPARELGAALVIDHMGALPEVLARFSAG
jgi:phosphoglycolate phosphatase